VGAQVRKEGAETPELRRDAVELDLRSLELLPARLAAAEERPEAPFGAQPLTLELECVRVARGEGVLDRGTRLRTAGVAEQRFDFELESGQVLSHGVPGSIMRAGAPGHMGRRTHLRTACGPPSRTVVCLLAAVLALALAAAAGTAEPARAAKPSLAARLASALAVAGLDHSRSAALAVDLRTGRVVFARNPTLSLVPASNEKIAVAYAALALLGPSYRFHTDVVGRGALAGGVWSGDLFLKGYGDPTLTLNDVDALAARIAARGIQHVTGAVVGDESWFDSRRTGPGWRSRFYVNESPPLSALTVARATYRGKTAPKPALAAAALLRQALAARGVLVARPARLGKLPQQGLLLASDTSPSLSAIVRFMGRESDNHTAELLLKHLGAVELGLGTTAAGARVVRTYLAAAEVPLGGVHVVDGSGLSSLDRFTASAVVALLQAGAANPAIRDAFLGSLAVAGVDGTLRKRLVTAPARGRVIAKTGTTRIACALSGFVGDRYVFAVIHNGSPVATWAARKAQDRFATALARG